MYQKARPLEFVRKSNEAIECISDRSVLVRIEGKLGVSGHVEYGVTFLEDNLARKISHC
jgi:hypothetical protein